LIRVLCLRSKRGFWVPGLETQLVEMQCEAERLAAPPRVTLPLVQVHPVWVHVSVQYLKMPYVNRQGAQVLKVLPRCQAASSSSRNT
jgi:hypothetical protein